MPINNKKDIYSVDSSIPQDKFKLIHSDETLHDTKFETKAVGWLKDSVTRFAKNKLSVIAACILAFLALFAIITPIVSPKNYFVSPAGKGQFYDSRFCEVLPCIKPFKGTNCGFWDGTKIETIGESTYKLAQYDDSNYTKYTYISEKSKTAKTIENGNVVIKTITSYKVRTNTYAVGVANNLKVFKEQYQELYNYEIEKGISLTQDFEGNIHRSILKPMTDPTTYINGEVATKLAAEGVSPEVIATIQDGMKNYYNNVANEYIYYKVWPNKRAGEYLSGSFAPYINNEGKVEDIYERDINGDLVLFHDKGGEYSIRVDYYDYFTFKNGFEPIYAFGSNNRGQDILLRLAKGTAFSLLLGVGVSLINFIIGLIWGAVSGYYGGRADLIMERVTDIIGNVPTLVVMSICSIRLGNAQDLPSGVAIVLSFLIAFVYNGWVGVSYTTRMQFYRFKGQEYVLASRTLGAKDRRLIFKHILPNAAGTLVTSCVLMIPGVIFSESSLSYLGIVDFATSGIDSVGTLLQEGQSVIQSSPHVLIFPVALIALLMISFNLFGNGLRDAFNTTLRGSED